MVRQAAASERSLRVEREWEVKMIGGLTKPR